MSMAKELADLPRNLDQNAARNAAMEKTTFSAKRMRLHGQSKYPSSYFKFLAFSLFFQV
jgi:hypothetical protein